MTTLRGPTEDIKNIVENFNEELEDLDEKTKNKMIGIKSDFDKEIEAQNKAEFAKAEFAIEQNKLASARFTTENASASASFETEKSTDKDPYEWDLDEAYRTSTSWDDFGKLLAEYLLQILKLLFEFLKSKAYDINQKNVENSVKHIAQSHRKKGEADDLEKELNKGRIFQAKHEETKKKISTLRSEAKKHEEEAERLKTPSGLVKFFNNLAEASIAERKRIRETRVDRLLNQGSHRSTAPAKITGLPKIVDPTPAVELTPEEKLKNSYGKVVNNLKELNRTFEGKADEFKPSLLFSKQARQPAKKLPQNKKTVVKKARSSQSKI